VTSLQPYFRQLGAHPLLTLAEEISLAREYRRTGDRRHLDRLVEGNLRLVVKIARDYRRTRIPFEDLVQEGNLGLLHAVRHFDPERGVRLSTYSAWWIRAYMLRAALAGARLVKLGTTEAQRKLFFRLRKEQARLAAQGIEPDPQALARELGVPVAAVTEMAHRLGARESSLDVGDEGQARRATLAATGEAPEEAVANAELRARVRASVARFAAGLGARDRELFEQRWLTDEPCTLADFGGATGISRERARQLEARLLRRLREQLVSDDGILAAA
jgi:RNA polymerase sigma-32 factor